MSSFTKMSSYLIVLVRFFSRMGSLRPYRKCSTLLAALGVLLVYLLFAAICDKFKFTPFSPQCYQLKDGKDTNTSEIILGTTQNAASRDMTLERVRNIELTTLDKESGRNETRQKFLIYLCDSKIYCYGLGDRQRAIVGVYLLSLVTNRTFGLIMKTPSPLQEFYRPHKVNWDLSESELVGRTSTEIRMYGPKRYMNLSIIDFNQRFPQDVVYVRTNHELGLNLIQNKLYRHKLPKWAQSRRVGQFREAWVYLMMPTFQLRDALNHILVRIAKVMFRLSGVSRREVGTDVNSHTTASVSGYVNDTSTNNSLSEILPNASNNDMKLKGSSVVRTLTNILPSGKEFKEGLQNSSEIESSSTLNTTSGKNIETIMTLSEIKNLKGYDTANMNLVCAHVRLGMSFEPVRNVRKDVNAVWDFLEGYIMKGHHVYLATDSEELRHEAFARFGYQVHTGETPVVHIARVEGKNDAREGFKNVLTEQLLLMTSCKVLIASRSGFSERAAFVRTKLMRGKESYYFKNGKVRRWNP